VENEIKFMIPNALKTISGVINTEGIISRVHPMIPNVHVREKSFEEPLFLIFNIKGILNKGRTTLATTPTILIVCSISIFFKTLMMGETAKKLFPMLLSHAEDFILYLFSVNRQQNTSRYT
jgi:hypothetical protein